MSKDEVLDKCRAAMEALSGYDLSLYNEMTGIVAELEGGEE